MSENSKILHAFLIPQREKHLQVISYIGKGPSGEYNMREDPVGNIKQKGPSREYKTEKTF